MTSTFWANITIPAAPSLNSAASSAEQRQLAVAGNRSVVPLVYGEDRIGALLLNVLPAGVNSPTLLVQCLWAFACDSILDVRRNDQALSGGTTVAHYTGAQVTADSALVAAFSAQSITYTQALTGYAYSVIAMPVSEFDGQLNFTARVRGAKLYDPRRDSTAGGSGAHRLATPSTWEWSDNPALALGNFVASTVYGTGVAVDWPSAATSANACDALVGSPSEKRRVMGVSFVEPAPANQVAEALRAYAGCFLLPSAAGVRLVPDEDAATVANYAHASGEIAAIEALSLRDLGGIPTAVEVIYTDTAKIPWRDASVTITLSGAGTTRPWRLSQVRLPGVQRHSQANREAIERLNKLTLQDLTTTVEVFDIGLRHELADIVGITHPVGLTATPMRVVGVDMSAAGRWRLQLVKHAAAAYSSVVVTQAGVPDTSFSNFIETPTGVTGLLTNESCTVAADSAGTVASFASAGGTFNVFDGVIDRTGTGSVTYSVASSSGVTISIASTGIYTVSAMSADTATATLRAVYGGLTLNKVYSIAKARAGINGTSGTSTYTASVYLQSGSGTPATPTGGSFNFNTGALVAPSGWVITQPATTTTPTYLAEYTFSTTTPSVTVTGGTWTAPVVDAVSGEGGGTGPAGISTLTLEIYLQSGSGTPTTPTGGSYTFSTDSFTPPAGWTRDKPASSTTPTYRSAFTFSTSTPSTAVSAGTWSAAVVVARNGTDGTAGLNNATVLIYQRSGSGAPTLPSVTATHNFGGATTGLNNGWTTSIPAGSTPLYVSAAAASSTSGSDTITSVEWAAAVVLAQDGNNGTAGLNNAVVLIYQRSGSGAPTLPSVTATHTFGGATTGLNNGWTTSIPAGTTPLYVSAATASSTSGSDTITSGEWAAAVVMAQDGTPGGPGSNGLNSATVYLFRRTATSTAPALPSASIDYTFSSGVATGLTNGWTQSLPATGDPFRWITTAAALSTGTADTIAFTEWAAAALLAQDGSNGTNGTSSFAAIIYNGETSAPAAPSGGTFNFTSGVATPLTPPTGWTQTPPTLAAGEVLYSCTFTFSTATPGATVTAGTWSTPVGSGRVVSPGPAPDAQRTAAGVVVAAALRFNTDGGIQRSNNNAGTTFEAYSSWYLPISGTPGNSYWIRLTTNSLVNDTPASVTGSNTGWLALSSARTVTLTATVPGTVGDASALVDYEIASDAAGLNRASSGRMTLYVAN